MGKASPGKVRFHQMKAHQTLACFALCLMMSAPGFAETLEEPIRNNQIKPDREMVFQIGKITSNPLKQHKRIKPMADLLAAKLKITQGRTVFTKNVSAMKEKLESAEVDMFTGSAYEAAVLIQSGAGEALALKAKEGTKEYRSIIVVRADSSINSILQLAGKSIAFEDQNSTSAYRVPFIEFKSAGIKLIDSRNKPDRAATGNNLAHYLFSGSEQNSSALLYRGIVDAIALSDLDWNKADNVPEFQKAQFKIIHTSPPIPRAIEIVRTTMAEETKTRLRQILLNLHEDGSSKKIMKSYHTTSEFSRIPDNTLTYLRELGDHFKN